MKQEIRAVKYNAELKVEAYHFQGKCKNSLIILTNIM